MIGTTINKHSLYRTIADELYSLQVPQNSCESIEDIMAKTAWVSVKDTPVPHNKSILIGITDQYHTASDMAIAQYMRDENGNMCWIIEPPYYRFCLYGNSLTDHQFLKPGSNVTHWMDTDLNPGRTLAEYYKERLSYLHDFGIDASFKITDSNKAEEAARNLSSVLNVLINLKNAPMLRDTRETVECMIYTLAAVIDKLLETYELLPQRSDKDGDA